MPLKTNYASFFYALSASGQEERGKSFP